MEKQKRLDLILILLLLVLIGAILAMTYYAKSEGFKCLKNPTTYGIGKLSDRYQQNISCFCDNNMFINRNEVRVTTLPGLQP